MACDPSTFLVITRDNATPELCALLPNATATDACTRLGYCGRAEQLGVALAEVLIAPVAAFAWAFFSWWFCSFELDDRPVWTPT